MKKILVIEDNKTLAKLIAKKIQTELGLEVDVAYQLSEAKLFLHKSEYFLVLTDLNLPDAPNGEIVDYLLKKESRIIILSANIDKSFRESVMKKNIIDYVTKGGVDDINYIVHTIKRLQKNQVHKVLVVDDSMVIRKQMKSMLENLFFNVITVAHGEEAVGMIKTHPDISLVLTDYNMPVMDGLQLTNEIRKLYSKSEMNIIAVSGNEDEQITALFLKQGANDYIKKPFSKEEFSCRVNNSIEALENIHIITKHANRDFLTGLYNRKYFYKNAQPYFTTAQAEGESFGVAMINIDDLKSINETYGQENGDKIVIYLADILRANCSEYDLISRFGEEEFSLLLKNASQTDAINTLEMLREKAQKSVILSDKGEEMKFTISIGLSVHHENSFEETLNQTDMMLYNAKQEGKNRLISN